MVAPLKEKGLEVNDVDTDDGRDQTAANSKRPGNQPQTSSNQRNETGFESRNLSENESVANILQPSVS